MAISNDRDILRGIPLIKIKHSRDSISRIILQASARGAFRNEAAENAEKINYTWEQNGDTIKLPDSFILPDDEKWRKQEIRIELQIPEGTHVTIDDHLKNFMGYHKHISYEDLGETYYYMNNDGLVKSRK
jgi:hypothetical protein